MWTGGCLCGTVRFRAEGAPVNVNHCHCLQCQRVSGAAMATWAAWPVAAVHIEQGTARGFASSPGVRRSFCADCGSTLFWQRTGAGATTIDVAAGSLDSPDGLQPSEHLYGKSRRPWLPLADGLPVYREHRPRP